MILLQAQSSAHTLTIITAFFAEGYRLAYTLAWTPGLINKTLPLASFVTLKIWAVSESLMEEGIGIRKAQATGKFLSVHMYSPLHAWPGPRGALACPAYHTMTFWNNIQHMFKICSQL